MEREVRSEEPVEEILRNYDFNVTNIKEIVYKGKKGVWWIYGEQGEAVLKKVSCSEATLLFNIAGVKYLRSGGIRIPEILKTRTGADYSVNGKTCFLLSAAIEGNKLNDGSRVDLDDMAAELGRFHNAAKGFQCPMGAKQKNHLGRWVEEYEEVLEQLSACVRTEKTNHTPTKTMQLILKEFPYFYERGKTAIQGLRGKEYGEWVRRVNREGGLCHQDFSTANLLRTTEGIAVLDMDSLVIDIGARDVRKLLNKVLKKRGAWDSVLAARIMEAYTGKMKISQEECKVIGLDLVFPHLFFGAMHKYIYQRDKTWNEDNYYNRLEQMISFERSKGVSLSGLGIYGSTKVGRRSG